MLRIRNGKTVSYTYPLLGTHSHYTVVGVLPSSLQKHRYGVVLLSAFHEKNGSQSYRPELARLDFQNHLTEKPQPLSDLTEIRYALPLPKYYETIAFNEE